MTTETPLIANARTNPIATTSTSVVLTQASEFNIKNMVREIKGYKQKIDQLKKEVAHYKTNMTSLPKFKACKFELQYELSSAQMFMYSNLQKFQGYTTRFLTYFASKTKK